MSHVDENPHGLTVGQIVVAGGRPGTVEAITPGGARITHTLTPTHAQTVWYHESEICPAPIAPVTPNGSGRHVSRRGGLAV